MDFIGLPLVKIKSIDITTLCGEEHILCHNNDSVPESHQQSRSPTLYDTCVNKNTVQFDRNVGFVATDTVNLDLPSSPSIDTTDPEAYFNVVNMVLCSGVPNHKGVRISLPSTFNWECLKVNTVDYHDKALLDYIMYGFPLGLNNDHTIASNAVHNHSSALDFPQAVSDFIDTELKAGALLGPFPTITHPSFTWSPLMSHPKGDGRRIILDLSFGLHSVNNNTNTTRYDGCPFKLKLPNLDSILPQLEAFGMDARLYKVDISRAFRNVPIDPADAIHLGIKWNYQFFVDKNLAFGAVHGTAIFQRISDLVHFLMAKRGFIVHNYIDDIYAVAHKDSADEAFATLKDILHNIGLPLNDNKVFAPCTTLNIMGIVVDIQTRTFSITPEKMREISHTCIQFFLRDRFTKRELQSLLGKLLYISRCVTGSRRFLNRMLCTLRKNHNSKNIHPDTEFRMDLLWFIQFLRVFNGMVAFKRNPVEHHIFVDATLMGLGAIWGNKTYTTTIPDELRDIFSITQYKMYNIVVAVNTWAHLWQDKVILISCDNQSAVSVCSSGKTKDPFLNACLHALWLHTARFNVDLRVVHIPGKDNVIADALSHNIFQGEGYENWNAKLYDIFSVCL